MIVYSAIIAKNRGCVNRFPSLCGKKEALREGERLRRSDERKRSDVCKTFLREEGVARRVTEGARGIMKLVSE